MLRLPVIFHILFFQVLFKISLFAVLIVTNIFASKKNVWLLFTTKLHSRGALSGTVTQPTYRSPSPHSGVPEMSLPCPALSRGASPLLAAGSLLAGAHAAPQHSGAPAPTLTGESRHRGRSRAAAQEKRGEARPWETGPHPARAPPALTAPDDLHPGSPPQPGRSPAPQRPKPGSARAEHFRKQPSSPAGHVSAHVSRPTWELGGDSRHIAPSGAGPAGRF